MFRTLCCFTLGVLFWTAEAHAQVSFALKLPEQSHFFTNHEINVNQLLTLDEVQIPTSAKVLSLKKTTISSRTTEGKLLVEVVPESLQCDLDVAGALLRFDSANPDVKAPMEELQQFVDELRVEAKLLLKLDYDEKNKLISVKLPDGEFEKLPEELKPRLGAASLKTLAETYSIALPDELVKVGDFWERSTEHKMSEGQMMTFRTRYEYVGPIEKDGQKLEKITGKLLDVNYTSEGNPNFQVTKSDMKVVDSEIIVLFDPVLGDIVSSRNKFHFAGSMTMVISNKELDGKLNMKFEDVMTRQK